MYQVEVQLSKDALLLAQLNNSRTDADKLKSAWGRKHQDNRLPEATTAR